MFRLKLILTLANQVSLDKVKKGVKLCRKMSIKDNTIIRESQCLINVLAKFDNLPSFRSQKILIEILIKLSLNPSQAFFLKIKSWKNPAFF